jgi:branched-subunit amino acid transport protein
VSTWATLLAMALVTYATRVLPLLVARRPTHPFLGRTLRYMPPAIFAALIVPPVLTPGGSEAAVNLTRWAGLAGALVAWRTQNVLLTVISGMGSFALLRWLLPA